MVCYNCSSFMRGYFDDITQDRWTRVFQPRHVILATDFPCEICLMVRIDNGQEEALVELKLEKSHLGPIITFKHPTHSEHSMSFEFYSPGVFEPDSRFKRAFRDIADYNCNVRRAICQGYMSPDILSSNDPNHYDRIKSWIRECQSHVKCKARRETGSPPKRLINLSTNPPRLVESPYVVHDYVCLSYPSYVDFWDCSLQSSNIELYKIGIPLENMPECFIDALTICQSLEIQYIWAHDLCIIQDDLKDWSEQMSQLHVTFRNALITISSNVFARTLGIFPENNDYESTVIETSPVHNLPNVGVRRFLSPTSSKSLSFARGWQIVERMLSTAVLCYTTDELVWECRTNLKVHSWKFWPCQTTNDTFSWQWNSVSRLHDLEEFHVLSQFDKLRVQWQQITTLLSSSKFAMKTDRFIAAFILGQQLESLCQIQTPREREMVLIGGLWEMSFFEDLCWIKDQAEYGKTRRIHPLNKQSDHFSIVPTWSWTSAQSKITFDFGFNNCEIKPHIQLRGMNSRPDTLEHLLIGYHSGLTISGKLLRARLLQREVQPIESLRLTTNQKFVRIGDSLEQGEITQENLLMTIYCDSSAIEPSEIYLLLAVTTLNDLWMLVLTEKQQGQKVVFQRIGICLTKHQQSMEDLEVETLRERFEKVENQELSLV